MKISGNNASFILKVINFDYKDTNLEIFAFVTLNFKFNKLSKELTIKLI